jgi:hypothetical protein
MTHDGHASIFLSFPMLSVSPTLVLMPQNYFYAYFSHMHLIFIDDSLHMHLIFIYILIVQAILGKGECAISLTSEIGTPLILLVGTGSNPPSRSWHIELELE